MDPNDRGGMDWMRDRLYSRTNVPKPKERRKLRPDMHQPEDTWDTIDAEEEQPILPPEPQQMRQKQRSSVLTMILVASVVFFLGSAGIFGYIMMYGSNVGPKNIDIEINGPITIAGGEELALQIGVVNRNAVQLELVDLIIDYPDGTRSSVDSELELPRLREQIGSIAPGERKKSTARAILFGEEDTEKNVRVTLEYRIEGSNAIFHKEKDYSVLLTSAPIALRVDTLGEIASGQEITFKISAVSNSVGTLEDVLITSEYPFGFEFIESSIEPFAGNTVWNLGDIKPGETKVLLIKGVLIGQDLDERIFRFTTGVQDTNSPTEIAAIFSQSEVPISIQRPFIKLALTLDGNRGTGEHIVTRGSNVSGQIDWSNTLNTTILDGEIEVQINGVSLDRRSIKAPRGFYRSTDDTILFNSETDDSLETIEPGDKGRFEFDFSSLPVTPDIRINDPIIDLVVNVKGNRISENDVIERIESTLTRRIKINSNLILTSDLGYTIGSFPNTGPVPPRAEQETTYTVFWSVANTSNDIKNVRVSGKLPSYVTWFGQTNPVDANILFNPVSGELIWNVGDVPAGTGYTSQAKEFSFKIGFVPSLGQVGETPSLIVDQRIEGLDIFTGQTLSVTRSPVSTEMSNDSGVPQESGRVRE